MLYMTVLAIRQGACVNNFAHDFVEINTEVKHLLADIYYPRGQFSFPINFKGGGNMFKVENFVLEQQSTGD